MLAGVNAGPGQPLVRVCNPDDHLWTPAGRVYTEERNAAAWERLYADLEALFARCGRDGTFYVVMGVQGAGKTTWIRRHHGALGPTAVFLDAAVPAARHRARALALAKRFDLRTVGVWVDTPLETALARNAQRLADEVVPESALRSVFSLIEPPTVGEGFDEVRVVSGHDGDAATPMHVARLSAQDAPRYRELMLEAYVQAADAFTSTADERAAQPLSWWVERIASAQGLSQGFGAFRGEQLVGAVALQCSARPKTRHAALLVGMYVRPAARQQGVGRRLLQAAIAAATARPQLRLLQLTVTDGNEPARRLYEAAGFVAWGIEPMAVRTPEGFAGKVHMSLRLPVNDAAA